ncbi:MULTISPECIES: hypothetical protein [Streptomyces]|uniref:hypothetical protein n=1 Tax=Streptomyces TaxID=1883 RepID=UPI0034440D3D
MRDTRELMRELMRELGFEMSDEERRRREALTAEAEQLLSSWDRATDTLLARQGEVEALDYQNKLQALRIFFAVNSNCFPEGFHRYAQYRMAGSGQNLKELVRRRRQREDIGGLFDDVLTEPPSYTPERIEEQEAAFDWPTLLIGASLTPFLQAISTTYGNRVAGGIGPWMRLRLRRIIRREIRAGAGTGAIGPGRRPGIPVPTLQLAEENGCTVLLDAHTPAEAVAELFHLDFSFLVNEYDSPPYVIWSNDVQLWRAQGTKNQAAFYASWDSDQMRWNCGSTPNDEPQGGSG